MAFSVFIVYVHHQDIQSKSHDGDVCGSSRKCQASLREHSRIALLSSKKQSQDVSINKSEWVYLWIMEQPLKQVGKKSPKLSFRMYGPFPDIKKINDVLIYHFPPSCTMHNVFLVPWLKL